MQSLGRPYVQSINKSYRRCGTLGESRRKASLVSAEQYLAVCYRYVELNPIPAGMVEHPGDYRWSSYASNARRRHDGLVCPHAWHPARASVCRAVTGIRLIRSCHRPLSALPECD
jgi:putative transposase